MPVVLRVDPSRPHPDVLAPAVTALGAGQLVAFPTETVYGLGADAGDATAVGRVFAAKGRPADNPLIVHVADLAGAQAVTAGLSPLARRLAARWWPGPLTLVLEAAGLPAATTGGLTTVAVRVPDHPVALALLRAFGRPVAAPSANRSGRPSPTTAAHVLADLGEAVAVVVDAGPCALGVESTVVDARGGQPVVLREGAVSRELLAEWGPPAVTGDAAAVVRSPGSRYRHYAPGCRVVVAEVGQGARRAGELAAAGQRVGLVGPEPAPPGVRGLALTAGAEDLARRLYAALREAETAGLDAVVVEGVPDVGIGRAVMDRLRRAAG